MPAGFNPGDETDKACFSLTEQAPTAAPEQQALVVLGEESPVSPQPSAIADEQAPVSPEVLVALAPLSALVLGAAGSPMAAPFVASAPPPLAALDLAGQAVETAEAIGAPAVSISVTGVAVGSAEAIGVASASLTVSPAGIASTQAIGAAVFVEGVVGIGIASSQALGTAVLGLRIAGTGIASTEAIGSAALAEGIVGTGVASSAAIGSAAVSLRVAGAGIASAEALGASILTDGVIGTGIASAGAIGSASVSLSFVGAGVPGLSTVGTPALSLSDYQTITGQGYPSEEAFGVGAITALPPAAEKGAPAPAIGGLFFSSPTPKRTHTRPAAHTVRGHGIHSEESFGDATLTLAAAPPRVVEAPAAIFIEIAPARRARLHRAPMATRTPPVEPPPPRFVTAPGIPSNEAHGLSMVTAARALGGDPPRAVMVSRVVAVSRVSPVRPITPIRRTA